MVLDGPVKRTLNRFFTRRVSSSAQIRVMAGAITVNVDVPQKVYVNYWFNTVISLGGNPCWSLEVNWGDGAVWITPPDEPQCTSPVTYNYSYRTPGTYVITVKATDQYGNMGSASRQVEVAAALASTVSASPSEGAVPLVVALSGLISGGFPTYKWTLDYGDAATPATGTGSSVSASHTYVSEGTFTATLTVEDALGASDIAKATVGVGVGPKMRVPRLRKMLPGLFGRIDKLKERWSSEDTIAYDEFGLILDRPEKQKQK